MVFVVEPALAGDIPALTNIQWAALQPNPLIRTLYPRGCTPSLAAFTTVSYQRAARFPSVRLLKAVDPENGEIVAFAKWIHYRKDEQDRDRDQARASVAVDDDPNNNEKVREEAVVDHEGGGWRKGSRTEEPPDCYTKALREWNSVMTRTRRGFMGNKRHSCAAESSHSLSCYFACFGRSLWVLDILHTHPFHQGKGAGAQLVRWGMDMADSEGVPCYVESSPTALTLFTFCAFDDVTEMGMNLGAFRAGMGEYKHVVMVRPPYGIRQVVTTPSIPPKSSDRNSKRDGVANWLEQDPEWVETISEESGPSSPSSSSSSSISDEDAPGGTKGGLKVPRLGEARMLDLRSSASTGSVREMHVRSRSASSKDVRASSSTKGVRTSTSMREMRNSGVDQTRWS